MLKNFISPENLRRPPRSNVNNKFLWQLNPPPPPPHTHLNTTVPRYELINILAQTPPGKL